MVNKRIKIQHNYHKAKILHKRRSSPFKLPYYNPVFTNKVYYFYTRHKVIFMQKITPFLWFNDNATDAIAFYKEVFKEGEIKGVTHNTPDTPGPDGSVMVASFTLFGQEFIALNGGPQFKFTEAVSFVVNCEDQNEVDYYWEKLSAGGELQMCGWLKDKFGLSWQVVPIDMPKYLNGDDKEGSQRAMKAMMQMQKLDIHELKKAYEGE